MEDCGNAPRKELLKDLSVAFAIHDQDFILANVTDDITLEYCR